MQMAVIELVRKEAKTEGGHRVRLIIHAGPRRPFETNAMYEFSIRGRAYIPTA